MEFSTLYEKSKTGKTKQWNIQVKTVGDSVFLVKTSGYVDSKQTSSEREITSGKNLGKKNETTKYQQACLEAKSAWDKQVRIGFVEAVDECEQKLLPMLASDGNKISKHWETLKEVYCQPKIDGIRLLVGALQEEGGYKIVCYSRTGIIVELPGITNACAPYIKPGFYLDGELYSDHLTFEDLSGLFRTLQKTPEQEEQLLRCKFHIFDCYDSERPQATFEERMTTLAQYRFISPLCLVNTIKISPSEAQAKMCQFIDQGYEGIILRIPSGVYEVGKRSLFLIKMKLFQDAEYEIIGAFGGQATEENCVIWKCKTKEGKEFHVRPKGSFESRKRMLRDSRNYIGKMLTVRFQNLTSDSLPRFPIGVAIREHY
jgi:DNA ligase-1